jgi:hypothetical protein
MAKLLNNRRPERKQLARPCNRNYWAGPPISCALSHNRACERSPSLFKSILRALCSSRRFLIVQGRQSLGRDTTAC